MVTKPQDFQYNLEDCEIYVKQFNSFPDEWGLHFDSSLLLKVDPAKIHFAIYEIIDKVKKHNAMYLVHISEEKDHDIRNMLYKIEFEDYFQNIKSQLKLDSFNFSITEPIDYFIHQMSTFSKNFPDEVVSNLFYEIYKLECLTSDDIPNRIRFRHPTFTQFQQRFENEDASLDTIFIATKNMKIIGITYCFEDQIPGIYYSGVHPKFRRLGIGTALKKSMALHLKGKGYRLLTTSNKSTNVSILKTNQKLGFEVLGRSYLLRRKIY